MYRPEEPSDTISTAISLDREDKAKAAKAVSKWIRQTSSVFKVRLLNCRSKTTKGQLILKANIIALICTKNERKYFLISALATKKGRNQKNKGTLLY